MRDQKVAGCGLHGESPRRFGDDRRWDLNLKSEIADLKSEKREAHAEARRARRGQGILDLRFAILDWGAGNCTGPMVQSSKSWDRLRPALFASARLMGKNFPVPRVPCPKASAWERCGSSGFLPEKPVLLGFARFFYFYMRNGKLKCYRSRLAGLASEGDKVNLEVHTRSQGQSNLVKPSQT